MLPSLEFDLEAYAISPRNGFLPGSPPLQRLTDPYYKPWEAIVGKLPELLRSGQLVAEVYKLPVLETSNLKDEREWRRAYSVLGFLTHAFIWGAASPSEVLPVPIARPFIDVANHLGLPPTATYAGLNLWNWSAQPGSSLSDPATLSVIQTLTGTDDESWFYLISVSMEAVGARTVPSMLQAIEAARKNDHWKVVHGLNSMRFCIQELGLLLERMYERCDPAVFYHQIRPLLAGSKGMAAAGLPRGVFYSEGDGKGQWREYSGGSNAQSSLIQFLDVVLGVQHYSAGGVSKESYIQDMRNYMPGPHRRFLQNLTRTTNIREYALNPTTDPTVLAAYNATVEALAAFRDIHIRLVTRYIIAPSRKPARPQDANMTNLATISHVKDEEKTTEPHVLYGTGGTALIPFLKRTRDETKAAASEG
ncbi:uncharacterized protein K452DRAFT_255812 [Aplosporella prunicola CBS 121167]|uniref:Indoleamine 2,3-dioxygenase n=1 Tax=Aplosporella prunicola CBS 121167 TaxID=1176127 RepID=A0A6A6B4U3_9PEZI|nr:uncharacterized protein K452DRAFT_255812 [Aplosporella prunicola CBS 121167]KAF2138876.1 hypothetical protein K452DRAFT_255812 [Aplosporella prunicola CBS 121167]